MNMTDYYKKRNQEFINMAFQIESILLSKNNNNRLHDIIKNISKLLKRTTIHITTESKIFYPLYLTGRDSELEQVITKLMIDIVTLNKIIDQYRTKWEATEHIKNGSQEFIYETHKLLISIVRHCHLENSVIYPLIETYNTSLHPPNLNSGTGLIDSNVA